jgi:hypothetical protein
LESLGHLQGGLQGYLQGRLQGGLQGQLQSQLQGQLQGHAYKVISKVVSKVVSKIICKVISKVISRVVGIELAFAIFRRKRKAARCQTGRLTPGVKAFNQLTPEGNALTIYLKKPNSEAKESFSLNRKPPLPSFENSSSMGLISISDPRPINSPSKARARNAGFLLGRATAVSFAAHLQLQGTTL